MPWGMAKKLGKKKKGTMAEKEEHWLESPRLWELPTELMPKIGIMFQTSDGYYRDQVRSHRHRAQTSGYQ